MSKAADLRYTPQAGGRKPEKGRLLRGGQEQLIQRAIIDKRPEAVQAWLDERYPAIAALAKTEGGEIHWGDETALSNTDVRGRGYAPSDKTPVSYVTAGKREKLSMVATVTNQGRLAERTDKIEVFYLPSNSPNSIPRNA